MEIKYEDKIVAFLDVLGFSNLVFNDKIEPITRYYEMILTDFKEAAIKNDLRFLLISDSIVVHAPLSKKSLLIIIRVLGELQHRLLLKGILIRGGISFGKLYINETDNIIVGAGLINAYTLESLAVFPRIILDRSFISLYWSGSNEFLMATNYRVKLAAEHKYEADFPFLNIGKMIALDFQPSKFDAIVKFLKENYYHNQHIQKYEWLRNVILEGVKSSLAYLQSRPLVSKKEPRRIRMLTKFIQEVEVL